MGLRFVTALFRRISDTIASFGHPTEALYDDGEPRIHNTVSEDVGDEADWMGFDPNIQSMVKKINEHAKTTA